MRWQEKKERVYLCLQHKKMGINKVEMVAFKEVFYTFSDSAKVDLKKLSLEVKEGHF